MNLNLLLYFNRLFISSSVSSATVHAPATRREEAKRLKRRRREEAEEAFATRRRGDPEEPRQTQTRLPSQFEGLMKRAFVDQVTRQGLQLDFPKCDVEAVYAHFARWSESRNIHSPDRAFRTWIENAERDGSFRLDPKARPATLSQQPGGERSDPTYAAFRFGLLKTIMDKHLKPFEVADILADHFVKFKDLPGVAYLLDQEIATLRGLGDTWQPFENGPSLPAEGWELVNMSQRSELGF